MSGRTLADLGAAAELESPAEDVATWRHGKGEGRGKWGEGKGRAGGVVVALQCWGRRIEGTMHASSLVRSRVHALAGSLCRAGAALGLRVSTIPPRCRRFGDPRQCRAVRLSIDHCAVAVGGLFGRVAGLRLGMSCAT